MPRDLSRSAGTALRQLPVVVVTGLRQAGKSTFLLKDPVFQGRRYLSLDDFATLESARRDPEGLLAGDEPVTIDEAQRCPELVIAIKRAVDRRRTPGRFLLSGSASFALLRGVGESLAGRAVHLTLHPFTRRERRRKLAEEPFLTRFLEKPFLPAGVRTEPISGEEVLDGGMPPVVLRQVTDRRWWFLGYEQTYLERDVRELSQVGDLITFRNFLRLAALRTGQVLNQSEIARDAKLSSSTAARYLGILEASFILHRLPPFLRNKASRLIKSPKLFMSDSGIAAHLTGVKELGPLSDEPLNGRLFETFVAQNLAGILASHASTAELCFWHVQGRQEVDFVIAAGRRSIAIEVKAASRFDDRDLSGLRAFAATTRGTEAQILAYNGTAAVSLGDRLYAIPLALLLS